MMHESFLSHAESLHPSFERLIGMSSVTTTTLPRNAPLRCRQRVVRSSSAAALCACGRWVRAFATTFFEPNASVAARADA